jgi:hypothetical protein
MEDSSPAGPSPKPGSGLERFEFAIGILALAGYIIERCIAFAFLQSRSASGGELESKILGFFFGQPPYSIFDILLGFGMPEGMLGILNPRNILQAILQALHFLANWWIAKLPFWTYLKWINRARE